MTGSIILLCPRKLSQKRSMDLYTTAYGSMLYFIPNAQTLDII